MLSSMLSRLCTAFSNSTLDKVRRKENDTSFSVQCPGTWPCTWSKTCRIGRAKEGPWFCGLHERAILPGATGDVKTDFANRDYHEPKCRLFPPPRQRDWRGVFALNLMIIMSLDFVYEHCRGYRAVDISYVLSHPRLRLASSLA